MKLQSKLIRLLIVAVVVIVCGAVTTTYFFLADYSRKDFVLGVHFSTSYARYLGLDPRVAFTAMLDELQVKHLRLSAQWNEIEPADGKYDFKELDWQLATAGKRGVDVILTVGRRTPRWPECHEPDWTAGLTEATIEEKQLAMVEKVVRRYAGNKSVVMWQAENEPFLNLFGECPPSNPELLKKEIALIKSLDNRPVLVTDSGELGLWKQAAGFGDFFGTTLYRSISNKYWGYFHYLYPPAFYHWKAVLLAKPLEKVIVAELQAEPWGIRSLLDEDLVSQRKTMDATRLVQNVAFAKRTGFGGAYLWGAEWWYWLKTVKGDDTVWQAAKEVFFEKN